MNWLAIGVGAALGAWLRWGLGLCFNSLYGAIPMGTLLANLSGGFLIGLAVAFLEGNAGLPLAWRLFAITGFLGGLTTFSTFSAEAMILLQHKNYLWALGHTMLHLIGSIAFCIAGFAIYKHVLH